MKVFLLFFALVNLVAFGTKAQNLPEQNCLGAIPVCQPIYNQPNSYIDTGTIEELDMKNQGCLASGERNCVWYIINVSTSGVLEFTITPVNLQNDYDFAVWDVTGLGCSALYDYINDTTHPLLPIACDYDGTPGLTGLSNTITGPQWEPGVNVTAGQTLILNVSNFSSTNQSGYTLDFTPASASIYDTLDPHFNNVAAKCSYESDSLVVTMSEPITCLSLAADGSDFYITPAVPGVTPIAARSSGCVTGQFTNQLAIEFSGVIPAGNYFLHAKAGSDGNSLLDNCTNEQPYTDSIAFTLNPGDGLMVQLDTPACLTARVILNKAVKCNSVAADGSDFLVSGPSAVEVVAAVPYNCNGANLSDIIDITFDNSIASPGQYTLAVKAGSDGDGLIDTCGSGVTNTISWFVSDQGTEAYAIPDLLCNPGYTYLYSTTSLAPSPLGYQYTWTPGSFLDDSTAGTTLAYIPQTTTYQLRITDNNYCYRRDTANVLVSVRYPIFEKPVDTQICVNETLQLNVSGGLQYFWYPSEGLSCTNCANPIAHPQTTTTYYVVISDQYGCSDTLQQTLIVYPLPVINPSNDTTIFYGETVQLYTNLDIPAYYAWSPTAGLDYPNNFNPKATPKETTVYTITVLDVNNCMNTDSVRVAIRTDIPVNIPSAFSPNGDGKNDIFHLSNPKFQRLQEFRIFNRWGKEVFNTTDVNSGWDGNYKGAPQDMGVYNYVIRVTFPDGRLQTYTGNLSLVR